ncbi:MAG: ATP synthase F1 subunit delta [Clostridiales bacterium]|jgi:F-type H+-transporting ATPase subunit delta|nr:ATP synthase F1 subunit delta [Clostridiales bacterium]
MAGLIVWRRYAFALFDLCVEAGTLEKARSDAIKISDALTAEKETAQVFQNPQITSVEKEEFFKKAFPDAAAEILGLVSVMLKKGRSFDILQTLNVFIEDANDYSGIITAEVKSAVPLNNAQRNELKRKISSGTGKIAVLKETVDASLIGGILIKADGLMIDGTIKKKLEAFAQSLA